MKYDLTFPRSEFDKADRLVRSMLLRFRGEVRSLDLITSDAGCLPPDEEAYVLDNPASVGICFSYGHRFNIWVSPAYTNWDTDCYRDTVLHELCHGYFTDKHDHRFRQFFGRALYHYDSLISPIDADGLVKTMLHRYTKREEDLDLTRVSLAKQAVQELPYIARSYDSLTRQESLFA